MVTSGVKLCDDIRQIDWFVLPADQCPDDTIQAQIISRHFRVPHEPWGNDRTFVQPVEIRRSSRRILFRQESGIELH